MDRERDKVQEALILIFAIATIVGAGTVIYIVTNLIQL